MNNLIKPEGAHFTFNTKTVYDILCGIQDKQINLTPKFQREFVWSKNKQIMLIDTVLLGFPFPSVVFSETIQL